MHHDDFEITAVDLDEVGAPYGISFGDTVRIRATAETQGPGYADLVGTVYGQTMPSYSKVAPIIGTTDVDYAINVFFDERDEDAWFAPDLVEFIDHAPGTELQVGNVRMVRDEHGEWHEVKRAGTLRRLLDRLRRS